MFVLWEMMIGRDNLVLHLYARGGDPAPNCNRRTSAMPAGFCRFCIHPSLLMDIRPGILSQSPSSLCNTDFSDGSCGSMDCKQCQKESTAQ